METYVMYSHSAADLQWKHFIESDILPVPIKRELVPKFKVSRIIEAVYLGQPAKNLFGEDGLWLIDLNALKGNTS